MTPTRAPKKSESLEIRIPYPTKQAFMARCQADGRTASEALRDFIDQHLDAPAARRPISRPVSRKAHWIAGALIAAAVGAVAVPSLALPALAGPSRSFEQLDANHDGVLTRAEFAR